MFTICISDLSQNTDTVVEEIIAAGGKAVVSHDDVSTVEGANSLISTAIESFGRLDILVSNAGIINSTNFEEMTAENFIGSTKGYWNEELSIEQLFEHQDEIFNTDGFAELTDTAVLAEWMTIKNTGWQ